MPNNLKYYIILIACRGQTPIHIVPSGNIGLGTLPIPESNPFLLKINFILIAFHRQQLLPSPFQDLSLSGHFRGLPRIPFGNFLKYFISFKTILS